MIEGKKVEREELEQNANFYAENGFSHLFEVIEEPTKQVEEPIKEVKKVNTKKS